MEINKWIIPDRYDAARRKPLPDAAVELLAEMVDGKQLLLVDTTLNGGPDSMISTESLNRTETSNLPFVVNGAAFTALHKRGYIGAVSRTKVETVLTRRGTELNKVAPHSYLESDKAADGTQKRYYLTWSDMPYVVTKDGQAALADLRGRLLDLRAARNGRKEAQRLVVPCRYEFSSGRARRIPSATKAFRVVKETLSRIYVEDADIPFEQQSRWTSENSAVKGHGLNRRIEREDVLAIDVTPEQWVQMRRATSEFDESSKRATAQMEDEMAPIRLRRDQRQEQLLAELEDGLRDAGESHDSKFC